MYTVQVIQHLFVELCQLLVDPNNATFERIFQKYFWRAAKKPSENVNLTLEQGENGRGFSSSPA
jgi:hypothetical protein